MKKLHIVLILLFSLILMSSALAFTQWTCDENTKSYLKLDEGSGPVLADACPTDLGDNPAYGGSAAWAGSGIGGGNSLSFADTRTNANVTNVSMTIGYSTFTLEAWFTADNNNTVRTIVEQWTGWGIKASSGQLHCSARKSGAAVNTPYAGHFPTGEWMHVACVYNGTHLMGFLGGDGVEFTEGTNFTGTSITGLTEGRPDQKLCIGAYGTNCDGGLYWAGDIDEIRFSTIDRYPVAGFVPTITIDATEALNSSLEAVSPIATENLEEIEYFRVNATIEFDNTLDSWSFNFTANGTDGCSLGNRQEQNCYSLNIPEFPWIEFVNGTSTSTFKSGAQGDQIIASEISRTDTKLEVSLLIDEHYNPNIFKHYGANYNFLNFSFRDGANDKITQNNQIRIHMDHSMIPDDADQYKLDLRVNHSTGVNLPNENLEAYICNSTYVTGDVTLSPNCILVASKGVADLQDDGTKFRAIFTKGLTDALNEITWVVLRSSMSNPNRYYSLKTYGAQTPGWVTHWAASQNSGTTWTNDTTGFETEANINWFFDGANATNFNFMFWANDTNGAQVNTTGTIPWGIDPTQNYPPVVAISQPTDGTTISLPFNITFSAVDTNEDTLNVSFFLFNQSTLVETIVTDLDETNKNYLWPASLNSGAFNITMEACELGTPDLFCVNDTHEIQLGLTVTIIRPHQNEVNNTIPTNFTFTYLGIDGLSGFITDINLIFNGSVEATNSTPILENATGLFSHSFASDTQEDVIWSIQVLDNDTNRYNSSNRTFNFDDLAPIITVGRPAEGFTTSDQNMTISGSIVDKNLDAVNFTIKNSTADIIWNSTQYGISSPFNFYFNVGLTGNVTVGQNTFVLTVEAADNHNKQSRRSKYYGKIKASKVTKDKDKRQITMENDLWNVTIELLTDQTLNSIESDFKDDKQTFTFKTTKTNNHWKVYDFRVYGEGLRKVGNHWYKGHIVKPFEYWIDFEGFDSEVVYSCSATYCDVRVVTTKNDLTFESIGGLNVATETVNFAILIPSSSTLPNAIFTTLTELTDNFFNATAANGVFFNDTGNIVHMEDATAWSQNSVLISSLPGNEMNAYWRIRHRGTPATNQRMGIFNIGGTRQANTEMPITRSIYVELIANNQFKLQAYGSNGTLVTLGATPASCANYQVDATTQDWDINFKYNSANGTIKARMGANNGTVNTCSFDFSLSDEWKSIIGTQAHTFFYGASGIDTAFYQASYVDSSRSVDISWTPPVLNGVTTFAITNGTIMSNFNLSFGDGNFALSDLNPTNTYTSLGSFIICLNFTDSTNSFAQRCEQLNVSKWAVRVLNDVDFQPVSFNVTFSNGTDTFTFLDQINFNSSSDFILGRVQIDISKGSIFEWIPHTYFVTNNVQQGTNLVGYVTPAGSVFSSPQQVVVVDTNFDAVENATVTFERTINGTQIEIGEVLTGTTGTATFFFIVGETYDITAFKAGLGSQTASNQAFTTSIITIQIGVSSTGYNLTQLNDTFFVVITPTTSTIVENNSFGFQFFDALERFVDCGFRIENATRDVVFQNFTACTSAGFSALISPVGLDGLPFDIRKPIYVIAEWNLTDGTFGNKTKIFYWGIGLSGSALGSLTGLKDAIPAQSRFWVFFLLSIGIAGSAARLGGPQAAQWAAIAMMGLGTVTLFINVIWFMFALTLTLLQQSQGGDR